MSFVLPKSPLRPWRLCLVVTLSACGSAFTSGGPDGGTREGGGLKDSGSTPDGSVDTGAGKDAAPDSVTLEVGIPDVLVVDVLPPPPSEGGRPSGTYCGPKCSCSTSTICMGGMGTPGGSLCCVGAAPTYTCAASSCGCDTTQLDCTRQLDCGSGEHCCISQKTSVACLTGQFVASCQKAACALSLAKEMCDPALAGCPKGAPTCSTTTGPSSVGLPPSQGFGVCE